MAKVLVIEDEESLVWIYKRVLKNHDMVHSIDSKEIARLIPTVDCVISDFHVPGYDFFTTKKLCEQLGKPLILVSGGAPDNCHNLILRKPFDLSDFLKTIDDAIPG